MPWVDKPGNCEICGKPIILKSSRHKWCRECAEEMNKIHRIQNQDEQNRRAREYRAGRDPDWWKGKDTECRVKRSCIYGTNVICDYLAIEGHSRLLAGYPIKNGRCDLYKRGPKKAGKTMKLPETAPILPANKLREV